MSVNTDKKEITLISLMRDMYLPLVGYYNDGTKMYNDDEPDGLYRNKLNSAYVFGGPELLMDTITYNFGIEIDDYIYIDFNSFVSIVDSIGGITAEVTKEEVEAMNECTLEQNRLMGNPEKQDFLEKDNHFDISQDL
jgi:LCP family protein required for cell wall assembly